MQFERRRRETITGASEKAGMSDIFIDALGFIWIDDFRLPLRMVEGAVEFCDKDRRRAFERGDRFVRVEATVLIEVLKNENSLI